MRSPTPAPRSRVAGRRRQPLDDIVKRLPKAAAVTADVTKDSDCAGMMTAARAAHGPVDIVIANAGAADSAPFGKIDDAHWERMINVNLTGAFLTVKAAQGDVLRKRTNGIRAASSSLRQRPG